MVSIVSLSGAGGHPVKENAFAVDRHPADPDCWLCFLADGQGGRSGGARAAQLACRTAAAVLHREPRGSLIAPLHWALLLRQADEAVCADPEAGFTTLVGFCLAGGC